MPTVCFAFKKSLHCKSEPSEVYDPKSKGNLGSIFSRKVGRSGCSRSIANLKDVIHGSKRHLNRPPSCSPMSIGSSEILNPITHDVILSNPKCELKIKGFGGCHDGGGEGPCSTTYVGTLAPGGRHTLRYNLSLRRTVIGTPAAGKERRSFTGSTLRSAVFGEGGFGGVGIPRVPSHSNASVSCHKCGERFGRWEAVEAHHLSRHAVTELVEGDSSRKIVEMICRTSCGRMERVLKVHNTQRTLARFEEYREMVKIKAAKLSKKHSRCLADGNELLRFYGTTVACSLGSNGTSNLCSSQKCSVCQIMWHGFSAKEEEPSDGIGVLTTSTSGRAFESIEVCEENPSVRKALLVCRVVAGRVHRPLENHKQLVGHSGFDSLAGKVGFHAHIEELYLLNSRALLPCFVIVCKS